MKYLVKNSKAEKQKTVMMGILANNQHYGFKITTLDNERID